MRGLTRNQKHFLQTVSGSSWAEVTNVWRSYEIKSKNYRTSVEYLLYNKEHNKFNLLFEFP